MRALSARTIGDRRSPKLPRTRLTLSHFYISRVSPPTSKPTPIQPPQNIHIIKNQPTKKTATDAPRPGDKVVLIEDDTPNGSTTVTEERRPPTIIQAGGGVVGAGAAAAVTAGAGVGSRRRPLSSRISKANRDLHAPDNDPGHSYSQVDQYDDDAAGYYDEDDRDS